MPALPLNASLRQDHLLAMRTDPVDVLVIGGGVVGAGTALDSVSRGLRTALVESGDWASGTSSRSSKLVHGGLRYLEMLDFKLVSEALHERGLLVETIAPHLVHPVAFVYPLKKGPWERIYVGSGVALYDLMSLRFRRGGHLPRHRHLSKREALRRVPGLRGDSLTGAIQYYDAQVDDARHTMTLVRTAAELGALVASRTRVVALEKSGERIVGARVLDVETGEELVIHARQVVSATGVWTDATEGMAGLKGPKHVRASKGVHFLVARDRIDLGAGLILRTERSVLFVIPWATHWIVGTTDTDWDGDLSNPAATSQDIDYLLEHVNSVLRRPLGHDDIEGVYAGLRPLMDGSAMSSAKLSREHAVIRVAPGLVSVAGGKYTTYRVMAKDVMDEASKGLGQRIAPCRTGSLPLVGADGWAQMWRDRERLARSYDLSDRWTEHLLRRYGSLTSEVVDLIKEDPSLGQPVVEEGQYLGAEFVYAARHEGALHLEDVLSRRTHVAIEESDQGRASATHVARLMARELGWDRQRTSEELTAYLSWADHEAQATQR